MADMKIVAHPDDGRPLVEWEGGVHGLGCKPKKLSAFADRYPPLSAAFPPIPQTAWNESDLRSFCIPPTNQGQTSACGPFSLIEIMGAMFAETSDEKPLLSPWYVYGQTNGGQDAGTALPDLLQEAETKGVPLDSSVKHGNMFGPYGTAATTEAQRFRIETAYDAPTLADVCSALERPGHRVMIGIDIGANFTPDAGGFLPPFRPSPQGVLGHAMSVHGKKYAQGMWWPLVMNHWSSSWGLNGFAYLHPSYIRPEFGGWAARVVRLDPNNPNAPPPAG